MAAKYSGRVSFTVPAGAGSYAPERITFGAFVQGTVNLVDDALLGVTAVLYGTPGATGAICELWLPKLGATGIDADFTYSGVSMTTGFIMQALASYPGAQFRVKSAGVAGAYVVDATAD